MKKLLSGGLLALVLATGITSAAFSTEEASADDIENDSAFRPEIEKTVELTDLGFIVSITTEDEEALERMIERHEKMEEKRAEMSANEDHPFKGNVSHEMTILENGIQVEVSVNDASDTELIEKIQEHAEDGPRMGPGKGMGHGPHNGDKIGKGEHKFGEKNE